MEADAWPVDVYVAGVDDVVVEKARTDVFPVALAVD